MDRGARWAVVHRVAKSRTRLKRLSMHIRTHATPNGFVLTKLITSTMILFPKKRSHSKVLEDRTSKYEFQEDTPNP